jgi:hypothetical protein
MVFINGASGVVIILQEKILVFACMRQLGTSNSRMSFEPAHFVEFAEQPGLRHELSHFSKVQPIEQITRLPKQLKCKIYEFGMQSSKGMKIELILFQAFSAFH